MADLAGIADVGTGVVLDDDRQVAALLEILLDGLDPGQLALQGDIENIGSPPRLQADPIAAANFVSSDVDALQLRAALGFPFNIHRSTPE